MQVELEDGQHNLAAAAAEQSPVLSWGRRWMKSAKGRWWLPDPRTFPRRRGRILHSRTLAGCFGCWGWRV